MSALRQTAATPPLGSANLPGLRDTPVRGEASLRIAKRCMPPVTFAILERIVAMRSVPHGQPLAWNEVALNCDLVNTKAKPDSPRRLDPLRPYILLLAVILHVGDGMAWAEVSEHQWVAGAIERHYLYNKRESATLPDGLGKCAAFLKRYRDVLVAEQTRIMQEFAETDAKLGREAFRAALEGAKNQLKRLNRKVHQPVIQLVDKDDQPLLDEYGQPVSLPAMDWPVEGSEAATRDKAVAAAEKAFRNLRLITNLNPDEPGDATGEVLPASPEALAQLEAQLAAEEAALDAEEALLDAELEDGDRSVAATG